MTQSYNVAEKPLSKEPKESIFCGQALSIAWENLDWFVLHWAHIPEKRRMAAIILDGPE